MKNKIIFITGGARSGKSTFGEKMAEAIHKEICPAGKIAYIATAENIDDEFKERIQKHKQRRGEIYQTYEESVNINDIIQKIYDKHSVFIIECLTTWIGNLFYKMEDTDIEPFINSNIDQIIENFIDDTIDKNHKSDNLLQYLIRNEICNYKSSIRGITNCNRILIIISNEVGLGLVPETKINRDFRDIQGRLNMKIAHYADFFYITISGVPVRIR